ncbi:MAG: hypothetical protein SNI45_03585 [Rikenellaceae bacterium]
MISISVSSSFALFSRYDLVAMCGGFDAANSQLYVVSEQKQEGQNRLWLEAPAAHRIELIIYVVPKSLPAGRHEAIVDHPPFEIEIAVLDGTKQIYSAEHDVNAWGGAAINLNLEL